MKLIPACIMYIKGSSLFLGVHQIPLRKNTESKWGTEETKLRKRKWFC